MINNNSISVVTLLNSMVICHKGNDATSIPYQCCDYPYTLNGRLHYNCTIKIPYVDIGCYHNRQWVTCEQPEGMLLAMLVDFITPVSSHLRSFQRDVLFLNSGGLCERNK